MHIFFDFAHLLYRPCSEEASSEAAEEDKDAPNRRVRLARTWAIDQMMMLVRTGKVPKTEAWVKDVAQFIAVQAFFHVHEEVGPSLKVPVVPVATAMRDFAKERFFTLLGILINLSLPGMLVHNPVYSRHGP